MFAQEFIVNALIAGTLIALAAGLAGYFVVLRGQVFAADALSHVAFTGALAAGIFGADLRIGLFIATAAFAVAMALLGERANADDVVTGSAFAWILGLGALFLAIYTTGSSAHGDGAAGVHVLFGSIFGLSRGQAEIAAFIGLGISLVLIAIARPLMFATIDPAVATAKGLPVKLLGVAFLVLVGGVAAEATQAVGALLLLGLIAGPAGAALRLTARPYLALMLSGIVAVVCVWAGIGASYAVPSMPPSFAIVVAIAVVFAASSLSTSRFRLRRSY